MNALSHELRQVITHHLEIADRSEIIAIASVLCEREAANEAARAAIPAGGPRFRVHNDTVRDTSTGLTWTRQSLSKERINWKAADEACRTLDLAGHKDWRLPTIRELLTLVDYERHDPAIDTSAFECESGWYWTSTPWAGAPAGYAWFVDFYGGNAGCYSRGGNGFVRAVRGGQKP